MADDSVESRLAEIFRDVFDDDGILLKPTTTASDVDGWDSLTHVRLMLTVERRFNVRFLSHEIGSLKNVGDLIRLVEAKLGASRTHAGVSGKQ